MAPQVSYDNSPVVDVWYSYIVSFILQLWLSVFEYKVIDFDHGCYRDTWLFLSSFLVADISFSDCSFVVAQVYNLAYCCCVFLVSEFS